MPDRMNCLARRGCLSWCILIKWWGYPALQNSCYLTQKSCLTRWICLKDESASKIRLPNMNELCQTFRLPHKMKLLNQTRMHRSKMRLSHSTRINSNMCNAFWLFHTSYSRHGHSIFTLALVRPGISSLEQMGQERPLTIEVDHLDQVMLLGPSK